MGCRRVRQLQDAAGRRTYACMCTAAVYVTYGRIRMLMNLIVLNRTCTDPAAAGMPWVQAGISPVAVCLMHVISTAAAAATRGGEYSLTTHIRCRDNSDAVRVRFKASNLVMIMMMIWVHVQELQQQ